MRTQLFLSILAALVLAISGCGKKEEASAPGATTAPASPAASAANKPAS
jgi:predicted small lipoprotein YifL